METITLPILISVVGYVVNGMCFDVRLCADIYDGHQQTLYIEILIVHTDCLPW